MTTARIRSRASAKKAGTDHETRVASYLATHIDDRIERRARTGTLDRGDISGLRVRGQRVVVECKNTAQLLVGPYLNEAEVERGNDDAVAGIVVAKRHGRSDVGQAVVLMTLADLVALITGGRPEHLPAGAA